MRSFRSVDSGCVHDTNTAFYTATFATNGFLTSFGLSSTFIFFADKCNLSILYAPTQSAFQILSPSLYNPLFMRLLFWQIPLIHLYLMDWSDWYMLHFVLPELSLSFSAYTVTSYISLQMEVNAVFDWSHFPNHCLYVCL